MLRTLGIVALLSAPAAAQEFYTLRGHGGPIMDIAVSPSGQIATASFDNAVGAWTEQTPAWLDGHGAAVTTVAFLDDGKLDWSVPTPGRYGLVQVGMFGQLRNYLGASGYDTRTITGSLSASDLRDVSVLTPPSSVAVLRTGYKPVLHPSAAG